MIIPNKIQIGDTIGVVAPSDPIIGKNKEELQRAKEIVQKSGFQVKFSKNIYANSNGYSSTAQEKAKDINEMFKDKEVKMIWCAKGGENSNSTFAFLDFPCIQQNPKIICGYSDATSLVNIISANTGLVTFYGTNFKTIATDKTNYSYQEALKRFLWGSQVLGTEEEEYLTIQEGQAEGELIGGNLSIIKSLITGKYQINVKDKILFLEEFGLETSPALISNYIYYMKQNEIFDHVKGIWVGNYQHESNITLEQIIKDVIGDEYKIPIIKSNNFGHTETKTVIPIGTKARIDTNKSRKIELIEDCIK